MKKAIMIQGTCSNAGKSLLTAALCRIFLNRGYKTAPFKAQNMALNSFVTRDGLEMGRAQVTQAAACRIDPDVRMNPVLLKPGGENKSQVILKGKVLDSMAYADYKKRKEEIKKIVRECYESLAAEYDIIVIEGAGSPAEINLKSHDIVNMFTARMAGAPVLLAGDIDRGGVFAHLVGTLELLDKDEQDMIRGFIINKFRGDAALLKDGLDFLEKRTGKPVLGVVPMIGRLGLPEEDSVEYKKQVGRGGYDPEAALNIAVIDLPYISNFNDFDPFEIEKEVNLYAVDSPSALKNADCILLPGSKNVFHDFAFLKEKGFIPVITEHVRGGGSLAGICGGYQMLGRRIKDPFSVESGEYEIEGLGFLELTTTMGKQKVLRQVSARCLEGNSPITGYEIHHGITNINDEEPYIVSGETVYGVKKRNAPIWGSYIHGIFDNDEFRNDFINSLRVKKGLGPAPESEKYSIEEGIVRLARIVEEQLDMDALFKIMEIEETK